MDRTASSKGKHTRRPKQKDREPGEQSGPSTKTPVTESRQLDDEAEARARERNLAKLMLSYHIQFEDDYHKGRFPTSLFSAISALGEQAYTDQGHTARRRQNRLLRVKKLVQVAARRELYGLGLTETTWSILENDIFEHMRYNPTCTNCLRRWWKSDIILEPVRAPGIGGAEEAESNFYNYDFTKLLGGDGCGRNRMFGLLSSGFLAADVMELCSRDDQTHEGISSVLPKPGSAQVSMLPFLVCIAELTGKEVNTKLLRYRVAFAMQHALASQQRVAVAAAASGATFQPLSFCLTYKNTDSSECALFAACLRTGRKHERDDPERPPIRIVQIWKGELSSKDSAMQLLCLVDFIAEWSNTVYHKNIARCFHYLVEETDSEDSNSTATSSTRLSSEYSFDQMSNAVTVRQQEGPETEEDSGDSGTHCTTLSSRESKPLHNQTKTRHPRIPRTTRSRQ